MQIFVRQDSIFFELFNYRTLRGLQSCDPAGSLGLGSLVRILEKIDCVLTAPHCNWRNDWRKNWKEYWRSPQISWNLDLSSASSFVVHLFWNVALWYPYQQVLVVGNPANTNAFICRKYAPSIPAENFSCLTRLDQNRAQAQVRRTQGILNDLQLNSCLILHPYGTNWVLKKQNSLLCSSWI